MHRDLKPANVFLTRGGGPSGPPICKLLDFGLAKFGTPLTPGSLETKLASRPAASSVLGRAAEATPLTAQGTILGTFQYMAPEQIEGLEADARSDIWAFGCVLYEMLTGRRAFEGRSQASLIASILEREPAPLAELQPMTPPGLDRLVRTCLAKNPEDRFHTTHDLRLHLQWIREGGSAAGLPAPVASSRRRHDRFAAGGVALVFAGLAFAAGWWMKPAPPLNPSSRDSLFRCRRGRASRGVAGTRSPCHQTVRRSRTSRTNRSTFENSTSWSRSRSEARSSIRRSWCSRRTASRLRLSYRRKLEATLANSVLKRIRTAGGTAVTICELGTPFGIRWQDDRIVFSTGTEIKVVLATGGEPETLLSADRQERREARASSAPPGWKGASLYGSRQQRNFR